MADNTIRFRAGGDRVHTLTLDASRLMGDALLELEGQLGGESAFAWIDRITRTLASGWRTRDVRIRDILGIVFLARAQADAGVTWAEVAKETAPFAVQILDDDEPATSASPGTAAVTVSPVAAAFGSVTSSAAVPDIHPGQPPQP
ncbi:MAG: hypothetical protein L0H84_12060 [Pseudonocardia sp.]|nr:hypothetical protein [Pseudonocardia sp.]